MSNQVNLLSFDRHGLERWFEDNGERNYRARQLMAWLYRRFESDFDAMTDLSKPLRETLRANATVAVPTVLSDQISTDSTRKWLLSTGSNTAIETVFIPEDDRGTLCVSSQVGCAMDCAFCATGAQGFNRNLTTAEIVAQIWHACRILPLRANGRAAVTNVVFMGMGEPLANYRELLPVLNLLLDSLGFGLSKRRVTVSTSGLVPAIDRLSSETEVALAVSLHAPTDALRDELVPINRRYPLAELLAACHRYVNAKPGRHITIEYVMLDGVNDGINEAKALVRLLKGLRVKVNLIPFNPFPGTAFRSSPQRRIDQFRETLMQAGYLTVTRRTRGDSIDAACGQLAGKVVNRITHPLRARVAAGGRVT